MTASADVDVNERLEGVLSLVRERASAEERDELVAFTGAYLSGIDVEDLAERDLLDLYGAVRSLWQFGATREPGHAKVRVFNPSVEEHGWQSSHTVVEIVNDDMPFLVDSIQMEVLRQRLTLHFIAHPIVAVRRDDARRVAGAGEPGARESMMHVEVDRLADPARRNALAADLLRVLGDVRTVVTDWKPMRERMLAVDAELAGAALPLPKDEVEETRAFLHWLADNHFTFVGYRCHDLVDEGGGVGLRIVPGTALGLLRELPGETHSTSFMQLPAEIRQQARVPTLLVITKSNARSTVHRPGSLDYIGVKRFDAQGRVVGEHRFIGLYTSAAYSVLPAHIPLLRRKVARILARTGFAPGSHAHKSLVNILDTYPRDELFQIGEDELASIALGILKLEGRQRFRLFVRHDLYQRFVSCLIYAPRERYSTELRRKWQALLVEAFRGSGAEFAVLLSESTLVRVLITVRTQPGQVPEVDRIALERRLAEASRRWEDDLAAALDRTLGEARAAPLFRRYATAFPAAYREDFPARAAVPDIELLERAFATGEVAMNLYRPVDAAQGQLRFKLVARGEPVSLSRALPMLERMGLTVIEERPYRIVPEGDERAWLHDYGLQAGTADLDVDEVRTLFEDALARVFRGDLDSDDFNRLVLAAQLSGDEVVVLRAYARYARQLGFPLSQSFIEATLAAHPRIAHMLVRLFRLRFDPAEADAEAEARQVRAIGQALEKVANLNEDRVLRQYLALIQATTRTNFWRRDAAGGRRPFLSFKLDPARVPGMPEPRPKFEIFVHSPRFEGVHMRGGAVARGGLRWSDRPEDFRTEILGLMKAQMVKNTVIVPVGSKGGFVLKRAPSPADRDAYLAEGIACYKDYLRALLDLTDNRTPEGVVPPEGVRRHDGDDPYLVVAADKGTATFSDHANAVSAEYGFWLGDAFASGGSAGYDHKRMGITARGAWEAAKRHFREMGVDTQSQPFTVVGIGDMSGDVFGNGMLQSPHMRLVAAFDHRHVFLDPDPDAAVAFAERERLFALPRSSWADYDANLISAGGGVWPRAAKSVPLSPQVRKVLGVDAEQLAPNDLIAAILRAPVDLLYNGGIGTYVKAADESHADVGDRANDPVRVDGRDLRCKVVVEGGNLGLTQRGRIEYALAGGRINTDAIDNSGGVDTSDHEVNIKILLSIPIAEGALTLRQRNDLLASMTDDVAALVLRDNDEQTQVLSVGGRLGAQLTDDYARFIRYLEREGRLNRAIEFLPADEVMAERAAAGLGLVAPERAVVLAYAKLWLYDVVLASALPDDPWIARALVDYFPAPLRERFEQAMQRHPLKREIIANVVINQTINRVGPTFVHRAAEATGVHPSDVVRAHLLAREVYDLPALWRAIEALDNVVADEVQARMLMDVGRLASRGALWFLRSPRLHAPIQGTLASFAPAAAALAGRIGTLVEGGARDDVEARSAALRAGGVPADLAQRVAALDAMGGVLDIAEVAQGLGREVGDVAEIYFVLGHRLGLDWLARRIGALDGQGHWQALARSALRDDVAGLQRSLTRDVLAHGAGGPARARIEAWEAASSVARGRAARVVDEVKSAAQPDLAMLSVALRELRNLAGAMAAPAAQQAA
ncbi:MAG TPA: NAD-glutamate dehydrogenase [Casimicrobiaceae bacterium]|nr:NAD-glutamate dehydrogenase [Casimicrobiaceae bacterium]